MIEGWAIWYWNELFWLEFMRRQRTTEHENRVQRA
jgi:hypothetical protein